jgi:predicted transcriptional regulator
MDFKKAAILGSYISKDYAENLFRLLATYRDISASEAASRLNMHIKTVQDFMEAMTSLDILEKTEAFEGKRPYYRYSLKTRNIRMDIDLSPLFESIQPDDKIGMKIREMKNARVRFTVARNNQYISNVYIWIGEGRDRKERKLNLSIPQGKFLYHLPFPSAEFQSISTIMKNAGIDGSHTSEILDIAKVLIDFKIIEPLDA